MNMPMKLTPRTMLNQESVILDGIILSARYLILLLDCSGQMEVAFWETGNQIWVTV